MRWSLPHTILLALLASAAGPAAALAAPALGVDDCVRLALARAPAAQAAGFDVDAALARLRAALAAYAPRLSAQSEYGRSAGFDTAVTNGGSSAALLTVATSLWDGGQRDAQFAAARARLRSAQALEQQRRADVAFAVRAAYFTAQAANDETAVQRDARRTLDEYESLLQRQERVGLVTRNDVLRAHLAADTGAAAERAAAAARDAALSDLRTLTGTAIGTPAGLQSGSRRFTPPDSAAVEASPVLVDSRAAVEAAREDAEAVRSEWRSHVTLTASGGALGVTPDRTVRDNGGGQFLVGFSVPLYDGGATAARVAAAAAAANSAAAALRASRQNLTMALAGVAVDARHAAADLAAWQTAVPLAADNFELMRARYFGGGNVRLLEVLDALTQYVDARLAVLHAALAYRLAGAKQEQLVGEALP